MKSSCSAATSTSWIAGTGATDDGAGAIIAMEAMRILRALNIQPRRTIRAALWGGEEQGIFGSSGYVGSHYGVVSYSTKPEEQVVPEFVRHQTGPVTIKPEHAKLDAYFNTDNGGGKFLGIYAEGNAAVASIFQQWAAPIADLGFTTITMRSTGSTDHVSFDHVGLDGFQFIQDPRDYDTRSAHTNQDTYERLSERDSEAGRRRHGYLRLQHGAARRDAAAQATAPSRTRRAADETVGRESYPAAK